MAGIEVSKTGVDWVDKQLRAELDNLQQSKFDKNISIKYLQKLKNKSSYNELMKDNPGATIVAVQVLLKELGFFKGKIDGILKTKGKVTSQTMEAVRAFQRKNGLTPDGVPGPSTIRKLLEKFGSGASNTPKPVVPNNPKPVTPNNPKTPEKQAQNVEATLADLKNFNPYSVGLFDKDGNFFFKRGMEKSDSKGKYILVNGKKLYKLGNNKNGIYYSVLNNGDLRFGQFVGGEPNGWIYEYNSCYVYFGQSKKTGPMGSGENWDGRGKWVMYDVGMDLRTSSGINLGEYVMYEGGRKKGFESGKGTATLKDGSKYSGLWKDGDFHSGVKYAKDGKTVLERWKNGKKVQ